MRFYSTVSDAISGYAEELGESIAGAFRRLLETKHLYQSVVVEESTGTKNFWQRVSTNIRSHVEQTKSLNFTPAEKLWAIPNDAGFVSIEDMRPGAEFFLMFTPPHAKMYCKTCQRTEPFNLVHAATCADLRTWGKRQVVGGKMSIEQVYTLSYVCQSCKKFPEVLLVRRSGGKLTLSGRTPMEHIEVPAFVPKGISEFYSGALLAFQSNQVLAANFMLRTAIEQWAIRFVEGVQGGAAVEGYTALLPDDFKQRFPSLYELYTRLSEDIHAAKGSPEIFEEMAGKFREHFDARRIYKLEDVS